MLSGESIRSLLADLAVKSADSLESEVLDFKEWSGSKDDLRKLSEEVVCFANARGGTIVLGVRNKARGLAEALAGVGTANSNEIRRSIYDRTDPHILVEIEELVESERRLLLIHVPRGIPPHTTAEGVSKIRVGTDCKPLTGSMLSALLSASGRRDPTAEPVQGATLDDLDPEEIKRLRGILAADPARRELATRPNVELLDSLNIVRNERVTLGGLLLLGNERTLLREVPQHEVIFTRYSGRTKYDQRHDLRGPVLSILRRIEHLVSANNRVLTLRERGFRQLEFPDIVWEVAREAVLNALTHRDYFLHQGVHVALFRDRLEVTSPGGFPAGITPQNVLRHPPVHRNEALARLFQAIGTVNRVGLGVDRIYDGLLRTGKSAPSYLADEAHVTLVVPLETHGQFALFVAEETRAGRELELDDLLVLRTLVRVGSLDRRSAAAVLQVSEEDAAVALANLRERGVLVVRGRGKTASYGLRRDLADRLHARSIMDGDLSLDQEAVRLRVLKLLDERGELGSAAIRKLSGFTRSQAYRLVKELEAEGLVRLEGHGRGAKIVKAK